MSVFRGSVHKSGFSFCKWGIKRYFPLLRYGVEPLRPNHAVRSVYHQHEVLYIIKPQEIYARWRVMRYKGGLPPLMICTTLRAVMIYQDCSLDKKDILPF